MEYSRLTNNVMIVFSEQQRDSAIHTRVSIVPQTLFPSRLPHIIEQGSTCYIVGPFKCSSVYLFIPNSPDILCPHPFRSNHKFVLCFYFVNKFICVTSFYIPHIFSINKRSLGFGGKFKEFIIIFSLAKNTHLETGDV